MISSENEYVPLQSAVIINDDVEDWLGLLENEMRVTLTFKDLVESFPNMIKKSKEIKELSEKA